MRARDACAHLLHPALHVTPRAGEDVHPLFARHVISHRTLTRWGRATITLATRLLVWEAFRDPLNTRYVLFFHACVYV